MAEKPLGKKLPSIKKKIYISDKDDFCPKTLLQLPNY